MYGVVLHARPVRGKSHDQRNTTGEVATMLNISKHIWREMVLICQQFAYHAETSLHTA